MEALKRSDAAMCRELKVLVLKLKIDIILKLKMFDRQQLRI